MSRSTLRTFLGLEDNGIDVDINIGSTPSNSGDVLDDPMVSAVASSGAMTPEAAEVDVQESTKELDAVSAEIDEAEKDVSTLECYHDILCRSLDNNGINVVSAEMLNVGLDHLLNKYGVGSRELVPALEDYSNNAYATTRVSMEKVEEAKKGLKETVKTKLMEFINKIIEWFQNISVKLIPAVSFRIKMLSKLVDKAKNERTTEKIKLGSAGKILLQHDNYKKGFADYVNRAMETANILKDTSKKLTNILKDPITTVVEARSWFEEFSSKGLFIGATKQGNDYINISLFKTAAYSIKYDSQQKGTVISLSDKTVDIKLKEIDNDVEVPALTKSECKIICDAASKLLENLKGNIKAINDSKLPKTFKEYITSPKNKSPETNFKDIQITACKASMDAIRALTSEATKIIQAVLKAVHASLKVLGVDQTDMKGTDKSSQLALPSPSSN